MSLKFEGFSSQFYFRFLFLPLGSLLTERIHPTSTTITLFTLVQYKLCNSTNLVTRTSSSFVTVNLYCWDLVSTTTISVYPTFNNKYFQFYVHCFIRCYRHLGRITAITDDSKLFSFTLSYFHIYLAGSTALLLFLHSSYLFSSYLHYIYMMILSLLVGW